jgi:hypothetical protein
MSDELKPKIVTGLPPDVKGRPRADFRLAEFTRLFPTKGYRMWWSRAGICPCLNNDQTEQPDPNCPLCKGRSYYYFLPDYAIWVAPEGTAKDLHGNPAEVNEARDAVMIQAVMTGFTKNVEVFEKFGEWVFGVARATVMPENKLGYRDRLVSVDSIMSWAQIIEYDGSVVIPVTGGVSKRGVRYPIVDVNQFRSLAEVYRPFEDFEVTPQGEIRWLRTVRPAAGTRLTLHYVIHPVWIVLDHLNTYRDTLIQMKAKSDDPADQFKQLPVQAAVKLDFLVEP